MSKNKIVFDERFEILDQTGQLLKKISLTVRLVPSAPALSVETNAQSLKEPPPQSYEMKFVNGPEITEKNYYASSIDDLIDLFITMLQKAVDERDPETTSVKLNPNNHYFGTKLIGCPYCQTKLQRIYGTQHGVEIRCRRCKRIFTAARIKKNNH